ncbi:unnamed protein product [Boreogadus saida]
MAPTITSAMTSSKEHLALTHKGHSRCVQEVVHFLSKDEVKTLANNRMLDHFQNLRTSSDRLTEGGSIQLSSPLKNNITKGKSSVNSAIWRPW